MWFNQFWDVIYPKEPISMTVLKHTIIKDIQNDPENQLFMVRLKLLDVLYNKIEEGEKIDGHK